ncbi:unnamed protein product [Sphacelaria rigidula]
MPSSDVRKKHKQKKSSKNHGGRGSDKGEHSSSHDSKKRRRRDSSKGTKKKPQEHEGKKRDGGKGKGTKPVNEARGRCRRRSRGRTTGSSSSSKSSSSSGNSSTTTTTSDSSLGSRESPERKRSSTRRHGSTPARLTGSNSTPEDARRDSKSSSFRTSRFHRTLPPRGHSRSSSNSSRRSNSSSNSRTRRRGESKKPVGRVGGESQLKTVPRRSPMLPSPSYQARNRSPPARSPSPKRWSPSPSPTAPRNRGDSSCGDSDGASTTTPTKRRRSRSNGRSHPHPHVRTSLEGARGGRSSEGQAGKGRTRYTNRYRDENRYRNEVHRDSSSSRRKSRSRTPTRTKSRSRTRSRSRSRLGRARNHQDVDKASVGMAARKHASSHDGHDEGRRIERRRSSSHDARVTSAERASGGRNGRSGGSGVGGTRRGNVEHKAEARGRESESSSTVETPSKTSAKFPAKPVSKSASKGGKVGGGKKEKLKAKRESSTGLLSFGDDIGAESNNSAFQSLGAATENEFKRQKKTPVVQSGAQEVVSEIEHENASVAARLDTLREKKRAAMLGPSKISAAESRGQRPYQEDRHVVVSCLHSPDDVHSKFDACPPCFFAVYDGHNGDLAAEMAKSKLHTYVAKASPVTGLRGQSAEMIEGLLRAAFSLTEEEILKATNEDGQRQDGTTATACILVGELLVTANVGDSRAVLGSVGHDGESQRSRNTSTDHTPTSPTERERIEQAGGEVVFNGCYRVQHEDVNCRLAVSRSLGDSQFKGNLGKARGSEEPGKGGGQLVSPEPAVSTVKLEPRDRVIIVASDGLWDVMSNAEAVEIALAAHARAPASSGRPASWASALATRTAGENAEGDPANALVKEAVKRGTADNVTAIAVILPWD